MIPFNQLIGKLWIFIQIINSVFDGLNLNLLKNKKLYIPEAIGGKYQKLMLKLFLEHLNLRCRTYIRLINVVAEGPGDL